MLPKPLRFYDIDLPDISYGKEMPLTYRNVRAVSPEQALASILAIYNVRWVYEQLLSDLDDIVREVAVQEKMF